MEVAAGLEERVQVECALLGDLAAALHGADPLRRAAERIGQLLSCESSLVAQAPEFRSEEDAGLILTHFENLREVNQGLGCFDLGVA
ncbi:hypothetical protein GCM10022254_65790 [Actinomadura meridiana]|uniref:Uncharacterized protein n=1 Tax=Actinomadura meridiana TaxID=559626 RepID=A0ABP8CLK9_9ACTN